MMRILLLPGLLLTFNSPVSFADDEDVYRTAHIELTHELAIDSEKSDDLCASMAAIGIDYPVLLQQALSSNAAATRLLLWAGEFAGLDGAASEGFSYTFVEAAKLIGDKRLAAAAESFGEMRFETIRSYLEFEYGGPEQDVFSARKRIKGRFPEFWRRITE